MAPTTRITAGEWRGRVIETPRTMNIRPTRSMVRQSLFDILGARVLNAAVLDLYAGAGTVGFEALSRGAESVTFVDRDATAQRLIAGTAARFGCAARCRLVRAEVGAWLRRDPARLEAFDLAYVDAPYRDSELERVLAALGTHAPALVVCEHHEKRHLPDRIGRLEQARIARHGLTTLTFLQRSNDGASPA